MAAAYLLGSTQVSLCPLISLHACPLAVLAEGCCSRGSCCRRVAIWRPGRFIRRQLRHTPWRPGRQPNPSHCKPYPPLPLALISSQGRCGAVGRQPIHTPALA